MVNCFHCSDLAKYVFGHGIEVKFGQPLELIQKHLLSMHESYHYHMCSSTPFGLYQRFLGFLTKSSFMQGHNLGPIKSALSKSVDNSWNAHEGVATICEITAYMLAQPQDNMIKYIETLPKEYRAAINHFEFISGLSDIPLVVLLPIFEGIGYAVLATKILDEHSRYRKFLETDWEEYFGQVENNPDSRLKVVEELLGKADLQLQLSDQIKQVMSTEYRTCDQQMFLQNYLSNPLELQVNFQEKLKGQTILWLRDNMPFYMEDDSQENLTIKHDFMVDSWFKSFRDSGINVVRERRDSIKSFEDRYQSFLSQLLYVADKEETSLNVMEIDLKQLDDVLPSFDENEFQLYVLLGISASDRKTLQEKSQEENELHKLMMYFHFYNDRESRGEKQVQSIENANSVNEGIYALPIDSLLLSEMKSKLTKYQLTVACKHSFYLRFGKELVMDFVRSLARFPLVIVPDGSTLDHWLEITDKFSKGQQLVMYHDLWNNKYRTERDFCILSDFEGKIAFIRPSSVWISNWLLEKDQRIDKYDDLSKLENKFSSEWVSHIETFINRYSIYGF